MLILIEDSSNKISIGSKCMSPCDVIALHVIPSTYEAQTLKCVRRRGYPLSISRPIIVYLVF